jgi:hypothetical protein
MYYRPKTFIRLRQLGRHKQAFQIATQSAIDAGFTITSATKGSGLITATRDANSLLSYQNPTINILVSSNGSTSNINVASTVGGQIVDYGLLRKRLRIFALLFRKDSLWVFAAPNHIC